MKYWSAVDVIFLLGAGAAVDAGKPMTCPL